MSSHDVHNTPAIQRLSAISTKKANVEPLVVMSTIITFTTSIIIVATINIITVIITIIITL